MATIQSIAFVDDLDGKEIDPDDVHTISWSWLGVEYQLDVSSANLEKVETGKITIAKLLEVSTRVGGRKQSTAPRTAKPRGTKTGAAADSVAIREFANGPRHRDIPSAPVGDCRRKSSRPTALRTDVVAYWQ